MKNDSLRFCVNTFSVILLFFCLCVFIEDAEAQCAMCRTTVENNHKNHGATFGSSLNTGILYLLIIPYLLIATGVFIWYRKNKQKNALRKIKAQQYA